MVPPFFIIMVHIGKIIEEVFHRQGRSVSWFAAQLCCERSNIYNIFKRSSIDTALLVRISVVLDYDFFRFYMEEVEDCKKNST